ncbi:MAG: tetratricopeptide repeat protein [Vicinamibacteria bacterium]|nr:tetratricopeptide repeat protein [Vicinamibacteria bacterium]
MPPSAEYLSLVTGYASGGHTAAVLALDGWDRDRLRCDLDNLQAAAVAVRRCRECEDRIVFQKFSLRAAMLLHADREILEQFGPPVSEQQARCGTGTDAPVIERLAEMLLMVDREAKTFLSRFYVGMARHAHWSHCLAHAELWARAGLKRLPRDGTLLLTAGIVTETTAFLTVVPAPRTPVMPPRAVRQFEAQTEKIKGLWQRVRRSFEGTLAADPEQHEARLRLGRVLWRLRQPAPARASLEAVLSKSGDAALQYLAHLFLGRIHEDAGELAAAEAEYRAALEILPLSQPAAVAVSHVLLLRGDPEGASELLGFALDQFRLRTAVDPYNRYPMTHSAEGRATLAELRRSVAP